MKTQKNLKTTLLGFGAGLALLFSSCSKDDDIKPNPPVDPNPPTSVVKSNVTQITFLNNGASKPTSVSFMNKTANLPGFEVKPDGTSQIKFFGKNGRDMLQGDARGSSINMAVWNILPDDTIRIYQNNVLKSEYITAVEDNLNDGIRFTSEGETLPQAKSRFNAYVKTDMPVQSFKPR